MALGLTAQASLLGVLAATVDLTPLGWVIGLLGGVAPCAAVTLKRPADGTGRVTLADLVTLTRALIACAVAALVADSFLRPPEAGVIVAMSALALLLDAADGFVARRMRTVSAFGARFDGEVDAFLILVLSVYATHAFPAWVLALGLVRYAFAAAGWVWPWLRTPLPPRYWRKVVAATQGVVLTWAAARLGPHWLIYTAILVAATLLAESFGRDVWWLWCSHRTDPTDADGPEPDAPTNHGSAQPAPARHRGIAAAVDVLALVVVWSAFVAPDQLPQVTAGAFLSIPLEVLVLCGLALVLPTRARRATAAVVGALAGLVMVLKLLNMGYFLALDRPFNVLTDLGFLGPLKILARNSVGELAGNIVLLGALLAALGLVLCVPVALGRLTGVVAQHRRRAAPVIAMLTVLWLLGAVFDIQVPHGGPLASVSSTRVAVDQARTAAATARGEQQFAAQLAAPDPARDVAPGRLLTGLRGKDVLIAFVESYGRVAVDGPRASQRVRNVLTSSRARLRASGYVSRSAFLTSPTFGGHSWLAHATLESGLWVSDQGRFEQLMASNRITLSRLFRRAGWQTVAVVPSDRRPWPDGKRFYRFEKIFNAHHLGYEGPSFGFPSMPDQYALAALQRLELSPSEHRPVMAQIELASSHAPWAPLPRLVGWNRIGDGSVFGPIRQQAESATTLWRDRQNVPAAYADSIAYSLSALTSFVAKYGNDRLVMILLGDHQPATVVSGYYASRDVPITIISRDRSVLARVSSWHWQPGLLPDARAPRWRMDTFRNRLMDAYDGPPPATP